MLFSQVEKEKVLNINKHQNLLLALNHCEFLATSGINTLIKWTSVLAWTDKPPQAQQTYLMWSWIRALSSAGVQVFTNPDQNYINLKMYLDPTK